MLNITKSIWHNIWMNFGNFGDDVGGDVGVDVGGSVTSDTWQYYISNCSTLVIYIIYTSEYCFILINQSINQSTNLMKLDVKRTWTNVAPNSCKQK